MSGMMSESVAASSEAQVKEEPAWDAFVSGPTMLPLIGCLQWQKRDREQE
jgi:hypothetical protein